jgi:SAM-dependent methyltransferase
MPKEVAKWINEHEFPGIYYKYPGILALQWLTNRVLYHRSWLIRKELGRSIRSFKGSIKILDAGCGAGDYLVPFALLNPEVSFTGIDKSASNVDMIRFFCKKKGIRNVTVLQQDLNLPMPPEPWNVILCVSVLQYLDDPGRFISDVAEKLDDGGQLLLYVPVNYTRRIPGYNWLKSRLLGGMDYDASRAFNLNLKAGDLKRFLHSSGLSPVTQKKLYGPVGQIAYEISSLIILLIKKAPWLLAVPGAVLYFILLQPLILLLLVLDYALPIQNGNGVFFKAVKSGSESNGK